jgi:hypothetical protein
MYQRRGSSARLTVFQRDQTSVWTTLSIICREEVGQSLQGQVRFVLRVRLQHGNYRNCSIGALSARRRGLGIFAVAALTRLLDKYVNVLIAPVCATFEGKSASNPVQ